MVGVWVRTACFQLFFFLINLCAFSGHEYNTWFLMKLLFVSLAYQFIYYGGHRNNLLNEPRSFQVSPSMLKELVKSSSLLAFKAFD